MNEREETYKAARDYISGIIFSSPSDVIHFENGAKWADKHPHSKTIAEYLYKEKGYPISLNGDIPTFEEVVKDVQTYDAYKTRQRIKKACDGLKADNIKPNLESLWHDAPEEPQGEYKIVCQDEFEHVWLTNYKEDKEHYKNGWKECVECECIVRWAYIDDLLPKGGKK